MKDNDKLIKIAILFYMCSIIGYIYEIILNLIFNGKFLSHGILYGPWLPIYGTGAILVSLLNKYKNKPLKIFIISFFITGILEYICGYLLLHFLHKRLWDYRGWFLNINGFVSFLSAFCFGIGSIIIIYLLMPNIKKIVNKVNKKYLKIGLSIVTILFSSDVIITTLKYLLK